MEQEDVPESMRSSLDNRRSRMNREYPPQIIERVELIHKGRHYRDLFRELERNLTPPEERKMIFDTLLQLFTMKQLKMIVENRRGLPGRLGKMLAAMEEEE